MLFLLITVVAMTVLSFFVYFRLRRMRKEAGK